MFNTQSEPPHPSAPPIDPFFPTYCKCIHQDKGRPFIVFVLTTHTHTLYINTCSQTNQGTTPLWSVFRAGISPWFQACANSRALKIMLTVGSWSDVFVCACLHNDTYSVKFKWSLAPYRVLIMTLLQWSQNVFNIFPRDAGADLSSRPVLLHSQPTSVFFHYMCDCELCHSLFLYPWHESPWSTFPVSIWSFCSSNLARHLCDATSLPERLRG